MESLRFRRCHIRDSDIIEIMIMMRPHSHCSPRPAPASCRSILRRLPWLVALVLPTMVVVACSQTDIIITGTSRPNFGIVICAGNSAVAYVDTAQYR